MIESASAVPERDEHRATQREVNALVKRGIFFSVLWLAGFGSAIALIKGIHAYRLISQSRGKLRGTGGAWWCIVVGALGLLLWVPYLVIVVFAVATR